MPNASMGQIGTFMDPVQTPAGLRDLVLRHRWVGDLPVFSLRTIARRHTDPDSVFLRCLSYNTYLMRVRIALAKALADFAGPADVLKALGVDPHEVLKRLGTQLCDALPSPASALCKAADDAVDYVLKLLSLGDALDKAFEVLGAERAVELILEIAGVPPEVTLQKKPALASRATEIGDALKQERYDVAALCEVWTADVRDPLLEHWGIARDDKHVSLARVETNVYLGDGLLVGSRDGRIVESERRTYTTRGIHRTFRALDMLADDELFAQKGAVLARVDMGVGIVDLYMTHLYFGTGLVADAPEWVVVKDIPGTERPTNSEREAVRADQLGDLSAFIQETHRPENVLMVCGDFNIDGTGDDAKYAGLTAVQQLMGHHDLANMWVGQRGTDPGYTGGNFGAICGALQSDDSRFCADPTKHDVNSGYRIDYVLAEKPRPQHSFMLDVARIRRRPFKRQQPTDGEAFMSDHLGLDCTLLASRK